ncbi:hypothetical protein V1512DRAFT_258833 [Lipomyces arxii]|uniref:uncharacterized protein n=1 Tax=Lipomyces arxii TaxID=56418 RepID=UPI0034CD2B06
MRALYGTATLNHPSIINYIGLHMSSKDLSNSLLLGISLHYLFSYFIQATQYTMHNAQRPKIGVRELIRRVNASPKYALSEYDKGRIDNYRRRERERVSKFRSKRNVSPCLSGSIESGAQGLDNKQLVYTQKHSSIVASPPALLLPSMPFSEQDTVCQYQAMSYNPQLIQSTCIDTVDVYDMSGDASDDNMIGLLSISDTDFQYMFPDKAVSDHYQCLMSSTTFSRTYSFPHV